MNKYPIVILPGWMLGSKRFAGLANEFEKLGFKSYVVDFPGFEQGEPLTSIFNLTDYVKYLHKFLKIHRIDKAIFVCHSFGGRVALKLLSQEPQKAAALVISGAPGFMTISRVKLRFFFHLAKSGNAFFSLPLLRRAKDQVRKLFYKIIGARDFYHAEGYVRETFKKIIAEQLIEYMQKLRVPTLLLWGEKDKLVPVKVAKKMQKTIIHSTLKIVSGQGHMLPTRDPKTFVAHTVEFLGSI